MMGVAPDAAVNLCLYLARPETESISTFIKSFRLISNKTGRSSGSRACKRPRVSAMSARNRIDGPQRARCGLLLETLEYKLSSLRIRCPSVREHVRSGRIHPNCSLSPFSMRLRDLIQRCSRHMFRPNHEAVEAF